MAVATLKELQIGETFQFGETKPLRVGDVITIKQQYSRPYGLARVTKVLGNGFFEAKRIS
jgi:hypothetical protein